MSGGRIIGVDAVDNDEEILTLDVPDEALERAANAERQAFTLVYCTNGYYWYDCNWPQPAAKPPAAWRYLPRSAALRRAQS